VEISQKVKLLMRTHVKCAIAKDAGISAATIDAIMAGIPPRIRTAEKLAAALGVDPAWLIDRRSKWPPVRVSPIGDLKQESQPNVAAGE
jgi:transcriptional regulator with XRE-family HTH domain